MAREQGGHSPLLPAVSSCQLQREQHWHQLPHTQTDPLNKPTVGAMCKKHVCYRILGCIISLCTVDSIKAYTWIDYMFLIPQCCAGLTQFFDLKRLTTVEPRAPLPPYTKTRGTAIIILDLYCAKVSLERIVLDYCDCDREA